MKSAATDLRSDGKALGKSVTYIEDAPFAFKTRLSDAATNIADSHERLKTDVNNRLTDVRKGGIPGG